MKPATGIIDESKDLRDKIKTMLHDRKAILLAHNYQRPEVQDIADLCGDSLELSIKASQTDAEVIVFCGVHFMAETASILCPDKKVLLPVLDAGCPMADMITAEELRKKKEELSTGQHVVVISYVNTTADVKAETDICCTSANVIQIANSVDPSHQIFMTPDKNLAQYAIKHTGRNIIYWEGFCPVHNNLTVEQVTPEVLELADEVKSTSGMIAYAGSSESREFIIGTETGILYPLSRAHPDKLFFPADPGMICNDMKKIGLGEILTALQTMQPEVKVPGEIREKAKGAVDRMLAIPST
ncbi:MAG: quinolinate synthase [Deltaproteobacteria bacterium]|nr:quinolinate synthase [Deltaproteobacteria bacterium]